MHHFGSFDDSALVPHGVYAGHGEGYRQAALIGPHTGSVHTGLSVAELDAGGVLAPHVHSFEEGFYVLEGEAIVGIGDSAVRLRAGRLRRDEGRHACTRGAAGTSRRALAADGGAAAEARGAERDTFFPKGGPVPDARRRRSTCAPAGAILSATSTPRRFRRSTNARTWRAGLEGVFLKWLIDENFGAAHHRLLFIEYQPGVGIGLHDHTFEEALLHPQRRGGGDDGRQGLPGQAGRRAVDGRRLRARVQERRRRAGAWLETFAPQPPKENVFRFMAEWETKARELEG